MPYKRLGHRLNYLLLGAASVAALSYVLSLSLPATRDLGACSLAHGLWQRICQSMGSARVHGAEAGKVR